MTNAADTQAPYTQAPYTTVIAEDAPIGVQLWPTRSPEYAPNFTLAAVEIVRNAARTYVRWVYENDEVRVFELGQAVAVQYVL